MSNPLQQYRIVLMLFLVFFLFTPAAAQQTLYVDDDNCPGPGTGTPGDPFCTIMDAVCDIKPTGGDVMVNPGYYNESIIMFAGTSIILGAGDRSPDL